MSSWHIYLQMRWSRSSTIRSTILIAYIWFTHLFAQILMTENLQICITHILFTIYVYALHIMITNTYMFYMQIYICITYSYVYVITYEFACIIHTSFTNIYVYALHILFTNIFICVTPPTQSNLFPILIFLFYVETHKVSTSNRGGVLILLHKPCHEEDHSAHSSRTPLNGFENGLNLAENRIEYVLLTTWDGNSIFPSENRAWFAKVTIKWIYGMKIP